MNKKRFVIAYGNRDREDDGAGWHVLDAVLRSRGLQTPEYPGEWVESQDGSTRFMYLFQLLPEMAEDLQGYNEVIFIDAHNSEQLPDLAFEKVSPSTQHSAFTHHLSAGELLSICQTMTNSCPTARILTVRGFSFQFKPSLSQKTADLVAQASELLEAALRETEKTAEDKDSQIPYLELPIQSYSDSTGDLRDTTKAVIREHSIAMKVNGEHWMTFICTPTQLKEQALGFLYNEHVISDMREVASISLSEDLSLIEIQLHKAVKKPQSFHRTSTGIQPESGLIYERPDQVIFFQHQDLTNLYYRFTQKQHLHDLAGGFHCAGLSDGLSCPFIVEDLGRHNCIDKLAGMWLMSGSNFKPTCLMLSGRISSEMVMKSLAMGVRLIISRTTPTTKAIELAWTVGICLIGYMRANQYEVYSHPEYLV